MFNLTIMDWKNLFIFFAFMGVVSGTKVCLLTAIGICGQKIQEIAGESKDQCTAASKISYCFRKAAKDCREEDNEWVNKLTKMMEDVCRIDSDLVRDIIIYGSCVGRSGLPEFMARCSADLPRKHNESRWHRR
ncbi:hypothetical protein CEXT_329141 [Caerostris extrusa]|uniref:Uncharacterized protein n=1 Tax=Caerostris extrusa TaxID=172846 RepID=A0AAV4MRZ1_CAEEX|nr:hypothetical protein CEXT_329141 [Caerostris extrusa]